MKMKIFLTIFFALVLTTAASAQHDSAIAPQNKRADFSGKWVMDANRSKLDERSRIEAMTMTVTQTEKELRVESSVKRAEPQNAGQRRGGMRRGAGFGGDSTTIFTLDGKETVTDMAGERGGKMTAKATPDKDGRLTLVQTREVETPMGARKMKMTETWSLSNDGKSLTVRRETETPRGTNSSEMVFSKQ